MPKSRKKRSPRRRPGQRPTTPESDFRDALRAAVDSPTHGPLLGVVGLILGDSAGADDPAGTLTELVEGLSGQGRTEASAAVLAIATLTGDAELRRPVRRELGDRGQVVPRWLAELDRTEPLECPVATRSPPSSSSTTSWARSPPTATSSSRRWRRSSRSARGRRPRRPRA